MRARSIHTVMLLALVLAGPAWAGISKSGGAGRWRAQVLPVNDRCDGAIIIPCGNIVLPDTARGDPKNTSDATNDYAFIDTVNSCTGHPSDGRDLVYKLNVGPGDSLWLDYRNRTDGSIYLVTNCNDIEHTCVAGSDQTYLPDQIESIRYKFTAGGLYYLILDSYGINSGGLWSAVGQLVCGPSTPPSNDLCETATLLSCGNFNLSGSTQFAHPDYGDTDPLGCTGQAAAGRDVVYKLVMAAGDSIWINYSSSAMNASVYIVTDCSYVGGGNCVVGADLTGFGGTEQLRYRFSFAGTYYLILDGRDVVPSGNWNAQGGIVCANPPPLNDRCVDAYAVACGVFNWAGTTQFAINDYYFGAAASCTGFEADGRDVVYRFDAHVGDSVRINYRSITNDATMYIVTDCSNVALSCVVGMDATVDGEYETLGYTFPSTGAYYLILDTVDPNSSSSWIGNGHYYCTVLDVDSHGPPGRLAIHGISPNPFEEKTNLLYELPAREHVSLRIFDLQGRVTRTLVDGLEESGQHHVVWNGRDDQGRRLGAGVYFARLASGTREVVRRMVFVE